MSDFLRVFGITIAPNPVNFTEVITQTPLGLCEVVKFQVIFPPGCANLVGVSVNVGGQQFYPPIGDPQIRMDDNIWEQDVSNQVNSGQWAIAAFNSDVNPHTIQVLYYCNYVQFSPDTSISSAIAV